VTGRLLGLARREEPVGHVAERPRPRHRRRGAASSVRSGEGALRERGEHARGAGLRALDVVERQDASTSRWSFPRRA